ncbi:MAG: hypothetical protein M1816_003866 [Peltula sp. TS41687]|nr:MAG: hypothetical protein M1816_003866 [Peltula sp. TS41687]
MTWFEDHTELDESLYGYYDCRYKNVKLTVHQDPNDIEKTILVLEAICLGKEDTRLSVLQTSYKPDDNLVVKDFLARAFRDDALESDTILYSSRRIFTVWRWTPQNTADN